MPEDASLDVIAVGAHPDDVEIGCGGALAALSAAGYRVGIVDITDGEPTPGSSGPEERMREAAAAAEVLGVAERVQLDFPNRKLFDGFEVRVALAKVFRRFRPQLVLGLGEKTPLASPDHAEAVAITEAAVFYSRLTKWDDVFDHLPVHTVSSLANYFLPTGVTDVPPGYWPLVVDITETLEQKMDAVRCYASQFPESKAHVFDRVRTIAEHTGMLAGCAAGELFASVKMPCTKDLLGMLVPKRS